MLINKRKAPKRMFLNIQARWRDLKWVLSPFWCIYIKVKKKKISKQAVVNYSCYRL